MTPHTVYTEVVMDDFVTQPGDLPPRNRRFAQFARVGQILHRLPDHFEFPKRRVLTHAIVQEYIATGARVANDIGDRVANML